MQSPHTERWERSPPPLWVCDFRQGWAGVLSWKVSPEALGQQLPGGALGFNKANSDDAKHCMLNPYSVLDTLLAFHVASFDLHKDLMRW